MRTVAGWPGRTPSTANGLIGIKKNFAAGLVVRKVVVGVNGVRTLEAPDPTTKYNCATTSGRFPAPVPSGKETRASPVGWRLEKTSVPCAKLEAPNKMAVAKMKRNFIVQILLLRMDSLSQRLPAMIINNRRFENKGSAIPDA